MLAKDPAQDKINTIFQGFVEYISQASWKYVASNTTYNSTLLQQPEGSDYAINCIGLTHALYTIFMAYGMFEMRCEEFEPPENLCITMRTPDQFSSSVLGTYRCFDQAIGWDKPFIFRRHCVVKRSDNDLCFDATFSCAYFKKDAPFDYVDPPTWN